jgi:AcrR family transcriptional regulator
VRQESDRRARKKAQTRAEISRVAQALFAERGFDAVTVADIARGADVALQTVFNHFPTKEELFFEGLTPWVAGPADAVRHRTPGMRPLAALREYLVVAVRDLLAGCTEERRGSYMARLAESPSLAVYERELVRESERRLRAALVEAWRDDALKAPDRTPEDIELAAALTAAVWLSVSRVLIGEHRWSFVRGAGADGVPEVEELTDRLLRQLEAGLGLVGALPGHPLRQVTGWPAQGARLAG